MATSLRIDDNNNVPIGDDSKRIDTKLEIRFNRQSVTFIHETTAAISNVMYGLKYAIDISFIIRHSAQVIEYSIDLIVDLLGIFQ